MADYNKFTDEQLASLLQDGSKDAFTVIYERYWHPLWVFAANAMRTDEEARDLVQDVFGIIWEKRATINIHTSLKAFLYKTTLRLAIRRAEKTKHERAFHDSLKQHLDTRPADSQSPTEQRLAEHELIARFEEIVAAMPPKMRTAFTASRMDELSYQEIASNMGISKESVKTHIKHALKNLRKGLNAFFISFF